MKELFTLGELYVSDFLKAGEQPRGEKWEMKLVLDKNGAVRLEKQPPAEQMWGEKYWYRSGTNDLMKRQLKDIVDSISNIYKLGIGDVFLDIASNDGTLLSFVPKGVFTIGIDPCNDSFGEEARKHANMILQKYFSKEVYNSATWKKCSVATSISMFYDLDNPDKFIQDVENVLDDNGLWVCQMSYTPLMINQMAFDNICHEHIYYYSLFNFKKLIEKNGFKIMDVQLNDTNGGSFRVYMMKKKGNEKLFATQPYRDVCKFRIESLLQYENTLKLDSVKTWKKFYKDIIKLKKETIAFIKNAKKSGKKIYGYGASTKFNTLLQFFELDNTMITAIAERTPYKFGLRTVGTNIPIITEEQMRIDKPDYLFIAPWFFIQNFIEREQEYLKNGGKFIVPCPKFEVIGY